MLCPSSPTGYGQYDRHSISFFCPKQGQGVKPAASPLHPNTGQNKVNTLYFTRVHNYSQTVVSLMALRPGRIGIWKCWFLWREENRSTRRKTFGGQGSGATLQNLDYGTPSATKYLWPKLWNTVIPEQNAITLPARANNNLNSLSTALSALRPCN